MSGCRFLIFKSISKPNVRVISETMVAIVWDSASADDLDIVVVFLYGRETNSLTAQINPMVEKDTRTLKV